MTKFVLNEKGERIIFLVCGLLLTACGLYMFIDQLKRNKEYDKRSKRMQSIIDDQSDINETIKQWTDGLQLTDTDISNAIPRKAPKKTRVKSPKPKKTGAAK